MIHILSENNSIFNQYIREIRDKDLQKDSMRFRKNMERMGEIFAYEISKHLQYKEIKTTTVLGTATSKVLNKQLVLATILRAGLTLHKGISNVFDQSENAFISAYRHHKPDGSFEIISNYLASPDVTGKTIILADPMLATGHSMIVGYEALLKKGNPSYIHFVSVVASKEGADYLQKHAPKNSTTWIGVIDPELNEDKYIVPGIGDAGDLAFGEKL